MNTPGTVKIDDIEYVRKGLEVSFSGKIRIVILQRGWVAVGYFSQDGANCTLEKAAHIRIWGTTRGLGEIAMCGPTSRTVLDPAPTIRFHELTVIATLDCVEEKWASKLI
mgnify:CR=1 FL=1